MGERMVERRLRLATLLVWALVLAYAVGFSILSIRPHHALKTHMADLGQMDLAIWNTAHGRFVQEIKGEQISTRLTDHVEPIFVLIAPVFWLWDDVRALLVLQSAVIALGAWPVYWLARRRLRSLASEGWAEAGALLFVLAYLLSPPLEAANLAEFHAVPLGVLPILLALWWAEQGRWGRFAAACLVTAAVKEEMALLSVMLGGWGATHAWRAGRASPGRWIGVGVSIVAAAWFVIATFVIIPAHAATVYGDAASVYFQRYGELGDSVADIARSLLTRPGLVWAIVSEPARLRYLGGLLASVGGLALLGPEILLLAAPLLAANLLSAYPAQYSGEFHYSAPLVPYLTAAAIVGAERAARGLRRLLRGNERLALGALMLWLLAWTLGYHRAEGWTPLGGEFRWPEVTAHARLAERFFAQIPAAAPVSATTALYPHLSHRERIYKFPALADADYVLLEVNGTTDMHPADLRRRFDELIESGRFCIIDAADGFVLLGPPGDRCERALPEAFYSFVRAGERRPSQPAEVTWGDAVRFLGYDLIDDGKWRLTQARTYWEALRPLPADFRPWPFFVAADGSIAEDMTQRPAVALLWLPPERWELGEVMVIETLPWFLPERWALAVGALQGEWADPNARWPITQAAHGKAHEGTWVVFPPQQRAGRRLRPLTADDWPPAWAQPRWQVGDALALAGARVPKRATAGQALEFDLRWRVRQKIDRDYTVFVHLRDAREAIVAQADAPPAWFGPAPTSGWDIGEQMDAHRLLLPADLAPGVYHLVIGLYDAATGERLSVREGTGADTGNEIRLASVTVEPPDAP